MRFISFSLLPVCKEIIKGLCFALIPPLGLVVKVERLRVFLVAEVANLILTERLSECCGGAHLEVK